MSGDHLAAAIEEVTESVTTWHALRAYGRRSRATERSRVDNALIIGPCVFVTRRVSDHRQGLFAEDIFCAPVRNEVVAPEVIAVSEPVTGDAHDSHPGLELAARPGGHGAQTRALRRQWCVLFGLLLLTTGTWSVATPALSGPDELAQVRRAESVVRGEWLGRPDPVRVGRGTAPYRVVRAPATFRGLEGPVSCYWFDLHADGHCAGPIFRHSELVPQRTYVGSYPPLYYLLVGWPSRWLSGLAGVYWMRFLGAMCDSVFLATALQCALGVGRRFAALGVFIALTPAVTYFAGTVNPSSLEIAAALCMWACGTELVTRSVDSTGKPAAPSTSRRSSEWLVTWCGLSAVVLLAMRATSPLWFVVIVAALAGGADRQRLRALARRRDIRIWVGVIVVVAAVSLVWVFGAHAYEVLSVPAPKTWSNWKVLSAAFSATWRTGQQMVAPATLGLPVLIPALVVGLVAVGGLVTVALGFVAADHGRRAGSSIRRRKAVLCGVVAGTFLVPTVIVALAGRSAGPQWQGRYTLPFAVGIPITAGWLAAEAPWARRKLAGHVATGVIVVLTETGVVSLFAAMRRYAVGIRGPIWFLSGKWESPLPGLALLIVATFAGVALATIACGLTPASSRPVPQTGARLLRR